MTKTGCDGYSAGVVTGSLIAAQEALSTAFVSAMQVVGYEHPLTKGIRDAKDAVVDLRRIESAVANDAMTGALGSRDLDHTNGDPS